MSKIILDLCGGTGAWSKDYKKAEYSVLIITLPDYDVTKTFYDTDTIYFDGVKTIQVSKKDIYGILAAPPCPMLSFARTNAKLPRDLEKGMKCVRACYDIIWSVMEIKQNTTIKTLPLKFWALENPNGLLKHFLGKPAFEFNPYDFGNNYKKRTHLWGWFNEPKKSPIKCTKPNFGKLLTKEIHPEFYGKLTRQERRAITPAGFAKAFFEANQ